MQDPEALAVIVRSLFLLMSDVNAFEEEPAMERALSLIDRLVRAIAARRCHWEVMHLGQVDPPRFSLVEKVLIGLELLHQYLSGLSQEAYAEVVSGQHSSKSWKHIFQLAMGRSLSDFGVGILEQDAQQLSRLISSIATWLRTLIASRWTEAYVIRRWDTVGAALDILKDLGKSSCLSSPSPLICVKTTSGRTPGLVRPNDVMMSS